MKQRLKAFLKKAASFLAAKRLQLLCIAGSFLLFFLATRCSSPRTDLVNGTSLPRDSYGGYRESYQVTVEGLASPGEAPLILEIPVSERIYREEELPEVFSRCMEWLARTVPGDNLSLAEITGDVVLPTQWEGHGVSIRWGSSDPDLVSPFGTVRNESLQDEADVTLTAWLSDPAGLMEEPYLLPLTVLPPEAGESEKLKIRFLSYLDEQDLSQQSDAFFVLPREFEGRALTYSQPDKRNFSVLLVMGPALALLLSLRERQQEKDAASSRLRQLLLDYPEIVSKLVVFLGAGMTVRLAWENIVEDYERDLSRGHPSRFAYEEMSAALSRLKTGESESAVYNSFGRRCGLRQYMKLSGILEQNRRAGMANLRPLLTQEMQRAWEERKTLARRQGEEAGTRLLGPLFLMLVIVMVIIITPAILSFL